MAATHDNPIISWDIIGADGQYWAPNPYKTRLTLNYKGLPYRSKYIKFEDSPYVQNLPILYPPQLIQYRHVPRRKYPASKYPAVLPVETRSLQKLFVENYPPTIISHMFPLIAPNVYKFLDKASEEYLYRSRGGKDKFAPLWDANTAQRLAELRERLDAFAQVLETNGGPWVMGDNVTFADFVVGCALYFWHEVDGDEGRLWKEMAGWQNGKWAAIREKVETIEKKSIGLGWVMLNVSLHAYSRTNVFF
ncbi:hypothetical protein FRC06_010012 [Ceratobasidium sp. 370]|nr:hypothetical protein FRC06_010012 [Ceratobasidium sp. 370]